MSAPAAGAGPVLVVGDLNLDVVAHHRGPLHVGSDTDAAISMTGGGAAANTACWAAVLPSGADRPVVLVAARGDDAPGVVVAQDLGAAGVALRGPVLAGVATGCCVVLVDVDADAERTMLPDRGANDALDPSSVRAAFDPTPAWLHLSGYTLLHDGSRAAGLAALAAAAERGVPASVDAASAAPIAEVGAATVLDWLTGVDVVLANDHEVAALGGIDAVLGAARTVVAKHGAGGATWTDGATSHTVVAPTVTVVDTTGAGDAFAAGWIVASLGGAEPRAALAAAVAVGSRCVTIAGARPASVGGVVSDDRGSGGAWS